MRDLSKIFAAGFAQVFLVSANVYFISRLIWIGIAVCGFGISFLWTFNVRKISKGSIKGQLVYSAGAMMGGLCGVLLAKMIKH